MNLILRIFIFVIIITCCSNCANIIPPTGGPRDTLAPIMIQAFPKDSTLNFNAKKITLTFNEYVELKDAMQNIVLNPLPQKNIDVDYKLQNVFITLKDTLEQNTTYTINFGKAIVDVNEGNIYARKPFVFSTGTTIDNYSITGNVVLAQDGKVDSTLIAVLHSNLSDTSVIKNRPKYLAKVDGKGNFIFTNLPKATYNLFVLPNDFSKKYDDSTKLFAFLNQPISTTDSINNFKLFAYKQVETPEKKSNTKANNEDTRLKFTANISGGKYDVLDTAIILSTNKNITIKNIDSIYLIDSNKNKISSSVYFDSVQNNIVVKSNFTLGNKYVLVLQKNAVVDNKNNGLEKNDSISFSTLEAKDYGSIKIRTKSNINNAVLQILSGDKLVASLPFTSNIIKKEIFKPAEFDLRILIDENSNNKWDAGNYQKKKQPEKVMALATKLIVKPNWENEIEVSW